MVGEVDTVIAEGVPEKGKMSKRIVSFVSTNDQIVSRAFTMGKLVGAR